MKSNIVLKLTLILSFIIIFIFLGLLLSNHYLAKSLRISNLKTNVIRNLLFADGKIENTTDNLIENVEITIEFKSNGNTITKKTILNIEPNEKENFSCFISDSDTFNFQDYKAEIKKVKINLF